MQQQKGSGSGSGSEIGVTWEDQLNINKFGRLNNRFHELEDEIKIAKVCELNGPVVDKLLGTIVHNEKEAYDLYNYYAHHIGFSVRKDHVSYWPNTKNIKSKDFLCSKAGLKRTPNLNSKVKFQKSDIRTGCAAMIRFVVDIDGNWTVKKFIEIHNHSLANPADHHLLRSNRGISEEKAAVLKSMTEAGIRATDAFNYLVEEVGGVENVGFSKRDAFNFIQKERRARIENGDTHALIQLFKERQAKDNMFAWDVQIDKSDRLLNFFWSDGLARVDYDCFGDVIIFDTSYRLNKYNLVCAPFVGVNHHWQNILFGVAFLSEETIESFTWLFKTFLRVMDEKHPLTIFTDQDQAMARAIEVVLPNTRHRLCQWHISKKLPSKVHCFNNNKTVQSLFYICMSKCDSEEEFEQTWSKMIQEGNLQDHAWLSELYRIKSKWSTAFNKDSFCMEILSTQRSESTNNVCHGISKSTSSIIDCFLGLEKVLSTWRRNEQDEDFRCSQSAIVPIVKSSPILRQAAAFYSRKLYSFFEAEFLNGVGGLSLEFCDNTTTKYLVRNLENKETSKCWVVRFDKTCLDISCSCKKFEMMGLLCAHCIRVLSHQNIVKIPEKYLIMRWSSRARRDIYIGKTYRDFKEMQVKSGASTGLIFRNHVSKYSYQISTKAQYNKEAEQYMLESLKKLSDDIDLILSGKSPPITQVTKKRKIAHKDSDLQDPAKMQLNGVSNVRLKGQWEKRKRVNKKNKGQSPTLVDDIQSPIGTTFSIMPTCSSEENNESLEDASNELILSDEDVVRFQIGEVFAHMPREEVESRLENMKEDSSKELEKLEEEKESVLAQMADLKKVLYGKFKDSINLEED